MPELPEVETVVRSLRGPILNQNIKNIEIFSSKNFVGSVDKILNQRVESVTRRAKYIVIKFTNGYLVGHLRMTGKLFTVPKDQFGAIDQRPDLHKHLRVLLELDDFYLLFQDQRKFGYLQVCDQVDWLETKLGCEPLSGQFTPEYLSGVCQSSRQIKPLLLDQSQIAGLGNIYVDEVLWQAGVHPETRASRVTVSQLRAMYLAIPEILNRSIEAQGTTFLSYTFAGNQEGQFVNQLQIFNRAGQACLRCGGVIVKTKVAQRGTYICVICQVKG